MGGWYWVLVDGFLAVLAGTGAVFAVVLVVYCLYRTTLFVGWLLRLMFGEHTDGVPYYDEEDYP